METNKSYISIFVFIFLLLSGCTKILDKTPMDRYSEVQVWRDVNLANRYLQDLYTKCLSGGFAALGMATFTDESHDTHAYGSESYLLGNISSTQLTGFGYINWNTLYSNIQILNVFLVNIDKMSSTYPETEQTGMKARTDVMKGEAIFLRAFCYNLLLRNWGGVIIFTEPFKLGDDYLSIKRSTFKETVDFIAAQCDNASDLLGTKSDMEMGRATKEAALALKSRILLFAASDLTADGTAENELVGYQSPDRVALWTAAKNAAKAVMDMQTCNLENFGAPDKAAVAQGFFNLFRAKDLSSNEVIWGKMFRKDVGAANKINLYNGPNGFVFYGLNAPTGNLADAFQMEDGSEFSNHYQVDNSGFYTNVSTKYTPENIYYNREPRFYATILYDSCVWQKRFPDLAERDPLGIYERRTRITISGGVEVSKVYGIDTRQGPVDGDDGTYTGYCFKKWADNEEYESRIDNSWIELRYAEIIMNYAEACLELGEIGEATDYINQIRNRAGLPDFTGDIKEALRYERKVEFIYEDIRWYDMRRWKILDQVLTNVYGVDIVETTNQDDGTMITTWQQIPVQERGPVQNKMYWLPIKIDEMNRAPQLVQNPGY